MSPPRRSRSALLALTLTFVLLGLKLDTTSGYTYQTDYFQVPLDHFSFAVNTAFKLRYLYNDTYWNRDDNGPIFFYTGNEGSIDSFANNTGFMWDIAPEFGAMVVFAEHRFYGESFPENFSYTIGDNSIIGYLTVEQALADYAQLITWIKKFYKAESSPVIAFGGSYGGQLTAYIRMKYPHLVQGGIAASATILLTDVSLCELHDKRVASVFKAASPTCSESIRKSWSAITKVARTEEGMEWLASAWKLCDPIESQDNVTTFKSWLDTMYADLSMVNYPYPANFLRDLPGNPVKVFCHKLTKPRMDLKDLNKERALLARLYEGVDMYFNHTGNLNCLNYSDVADLSNGFSEMDSLSFDFQTCTEIIDPSCDDGKQDFFEPDPWNLTEYTSDCQDEFGADLVPQTELLDMFYGGRNILSASNIIFSNGVLDPWYGYGVLRNLSESLLAIVMEDAAHHLDLRGSHPKDPPSVVAAREFEKKTIQKWIEEYHENEKRLNELFPKN